MMNKKDLEGRMDWVDEQLISEQSQGGAERDQ